MTMPWDIGEVAMIDYASTKMFVIDQNTGKRKALQIQLEFDWVRVFSSNFLLKVKEEI